MLDWFSDTWNGFVDYIYRIVLTVFDFFKDFFWWVLDNLMQSIIYVLDGLQLSLEVISPLTYIDSIPEETKYFMAAVGFNECMGMIVASISIRLLLGLIPFVRIGG